MKSKIYPKLPMVNFAEITKNEQIQITESHWVEGNVTLGELAIINSIIVTEGPKSIFEIGTFDGRTTLNMALSSKDDCRIYTLDLPVEQLNDTAIEMHEYDKWLTSKKNGSGSRIKHEKKADYSKKITQLYGDSATFDFSSFENKMDLVFIDASHNHDYVVNDTNVAFRLLRNSKGVILWHDYAEGVEVVTAIDEILETKSIKVFHIENTSLAYAKII